EKVFQRRPSSFEELKESIRQEIDAIPSQLTQGDAKPMDTSPAMY
ncbi:hypothetical protein Trydic_g13300, partial [Trypoxylus dichotomus]